MKIIKSLEESGILLKVVSKTVENETKKKWRGKFHGMILGILSVTLLANVLNGPTKKYVI